MNTGSFRLEFQAPLSTQPLFQEPGLNISDGLLLNKTSNYSNLVSISTKIFQGSGPNSKLVSIQEDCDHQFICSHQLFAVDIGSAKIEFRRIGEQTAYDFSYNDFLKVIVHPNGKRISVLRKNLFINYFVEAGILQDRRNTRLFDIDIEAIIGQYNPSAEYIGGLAYNLTSSNIIGFKYNLTNEKFYFTSNACKMKSKPIEYRKWKIKFNQNYQNIGVATSNSTSFCIVDYSKMKVSTVSINETIINNAKQIGPINNKDLVVADSVFINDNKGGFYLLLDTTKNIAFRSQISSLDNLNMTHVFKYLPFAQYEEQAESSSCLGISSFNGLACFLSNQSRIHFMKLNFEKDEIKMLGNLNLDQHSLTKDINSGSRRFIEDVIYDSHSSKICLLHNLQFKCITLTANCGNSSLFLPLSKCDSQCKNNSSTLFWNHLSNQCQDCISCVCPNKDQRYFYPENRCIRDCLSIKNSISYSQYHHSQKCLCQNQYQWNQVVKQCIYKYKNIQFSKSNFYYYRPFTSNCSYPYRSVNKTAENINGHCVLFCQNGKQPEMKNLAPICQCPKNHVWNSSKFICSPLSQKDPLNFSGWALAFFIIFLLAAIGFCGWFFWKKYKSKAEEKKNDEEGAAQSDRKFKSIAKTNEELKMVGSQIKLQVCEVCFKHNPQPNCMGICGHYFHFDCVKQKINLQKKCPKCKQQFPNGVESLKLVQADEIFSIGQSS